MSYSIEINKVS